MATTFAVQKELLPATRRVLLIVLVGLSVALGASAAEESQTGVRIASDGKEFVAIWKQGVDHAKLVLSRTSAGGVMLDEPPVVVAEDPGNFDIVAGGPGYLVLWTDRVTLDLKARRLSMDGSWVDDQPIALPAADVYGVSAVWNGSRFFVVWISSNRSVGGVFGAFLGANGLTSPVKQLSPAETYFEGNTPRVAWNGRQFLVSWSDFMNCEPLCYYGPWAIRLMRVSPEGTPRDSKAPLLLPEASRTMIASDGVNFLGVYDQIRGGWRRSRCRPKASSCWSAPRVRFFHGSAFPRAV